MEPKWSDLSSEAWRQAQELFLEVSETGDQSLLEHEIDPQVAAAARFLLRMDRRAAEEGFLGQPFTLAQEIAEESQRPVFVDGQVLADRFQVVRLLGTGGMGEVYLARYEMFGEEVALKTIRRILAKEPEIRARFLGEVQSARRVTHTNVCRIFDIFEEGDTPFYSMEYLPGETLDRFLESKPEAATRKAIALQLAEGLHAAHTSGIIHRDFKPQNVILVAKPGGAQRAVITDFGLARAMEYGNGAHQHSLQAGTEAYLAPEVRAGETATLRSDIFAYGKVLELLVPGHPLAAKCAAPKAEERPGSLDPIIGDLKRKPLNRRVMVGATAAAIGGVLLYRSRSGPRFPLPARQKVVLNSFNSAAGLSAKAIAIRQLFLVAIRQSPLLAIVPDERMRAVLRSMKLPLALPAEREDLFKVAGIERASLVLEGWVAAAGKGLLLGLRLFRTGDARPALVMESAVPDDNLLVRLASRAAHDLRSDFGESTLALDSSAPLEQVTSASPEAVELYFQGVREYEERSDTQASLALVDRALAIDPNFALAHLQRALALGASFRTEMGLEAAEKAFGLRDRVTERERNWIEWAYYHLACDYLSALNAIRKNTVLFPDEAAFARQTGGDYCRVGRYDDAIPYNARSVELDPFSGNNWDEYICNLAEGNHPEKAIEVYEKLPAENFGKTVVEYGAGLAHLVAGNYQRSREAFTRLGGTAYHDRWARFLAAGPSIMEGRFAETASTLEADLAFDYATGEELRRYRRQDYLGNLRRLMGDRAAALAQARALCTLPATGPCLLNIRQGALLAIDELDPDLAAAGLDRLREIERRWPSTHSKGSRAHVEGCLMELRGDTRAGELLNLARGLWPDALVLYSVALWQARRGQWEQQAATLDELMRHRGAILKHFFPGLLVLAWLEQARSFRRLSHPEQSSRLYGQVLDHWGEHARGFPLVETIRREAQI
jgi:serine/threonine protein kinase/tetratricopeptide (TPR) repeat protein